MVKRYLATLLGLGGGLIAMVLALYLIIRLRNHLTGISLLLLLCCWPAVTLLVAGLILAWILRRFWRFPARQSPVSMEKLRQDLLAINALNGPIKVTARRKVLLVSYRYDDPRWCEQMEAAGIRLLYTLRLRLLGGTHRAILTDRFRRVDFALCPVQVKAGLIRWPWPVLGIRKQRHHLEEMEALTFHFRAAEIKGLFTQALLDRGWEVVFSFL